MTSYINSRRRGTLSKKRRFTKNRKRRSRKYAMRGGTKINYKNGNTYDGEVNERGERHGQGTLTYTDGRKYVGMFKDDIMDGEGTFTFPDGLIQEGMFSKNVPYGKGKLTNSKTGAYYDGDFVNNTKQGSGKYFFADGRIYDGEWKDDMMNGSGNMTWPNGDKYVGEWKDDMMNGSGNMTWPNGDKYVGEWKDDMMNGSGKLTYNNGSVYDGEWMDDQKHGQGTYTYPDGKTTYEGDFKYDKFSGQGVYKNVTDGYVFEYRGFYENDLRHGEGIITTIYKGKSERMFVTYDKEQMISGKGGRIEHDGTIEEGDFVNKKLINGTQTKPNGTIDTGHFENSRIQKGRRISSDNAYTYEYVGEFKDGKPDGRGSMRCMDEANGWKYEGMFKNGVREGYGKFTFPDGRIYEGLFLNDQPYRWNRNQTKKLGPRNLMSAELGMLKQIFNDTRRISAKKHR